MSDTASTIVTSALERIHRLIDHPSLPGDVRAAVTALIASLERTLVSNPNPNDAGLATLPAVEAFNENLASLAVPRVRAYVQGGNSLTGLDTPIENPSVIEEELSQLERKNEKAAVMTSVMQVAVTTFVLADDLSGLADPMSDRKAPDGIAGIFNLQVPKKSAVPKKVAAPKTVAAPKKVAAPKTAGVPKTPVVVEREVSISTAPPTIPEGWKPALIILVLAIVIWLLVH
jgi:hypothetical protein